jgi:hypothetical protein
MIQDHRDKFLRHCVRRVEFHELTDRANRRVTLTVARRRLRGWRFPIAKFGCRLTESLARSLGSGDNGASLIGFLSLGGCKAAPNPMMMRAAVGGGSFDCGKGTPKARCPPGGLGIKSKR